MVGIETVQSQSAVTSGTGTSVAAHNARQVAWAIEGSGTVTGGVVKIEAARTQDYAGAWHELDSIDFSVDVLTDKVYLGNYPNPIGGFVRTRVSSAVTGGGSISSWIQKLVG